MSDTAGLLDICESIAADLRRHAVRCRDGSVTWLAAKRDGAGRATPLGPHLYGGTAGVALFLAALYRVTGKEEHCLFARQAISPLLGKLSQLTADPARSAKLRLGVGGMIGLGSFLYALVRIGDWLSDPAFLEQALDVSCLFCPARIQQDDFLDIVNGSSGAVLALLALEEARPQATVAGATALERAAECGRHLLASREARDGGPRAWPPSPGRAPLSGFAHGAAGVCYALARLAARTRSPELLDAVEEGLAFERHTFSPEHGNWRDLRKLEPRFMTAWCHGGSGIALGRLGMLDIIDGPEIRAEILAGLEATRRFGLEELDHLCCGNCGRAEILCYAACRLNEPAYREDARVLFEQVLARAHEQGRFLLTTPGEEPTFQASLLQGVSGVGLSFLRWFSPVSLASPLLLQ